MTLNEFQSLWWTLKEAAEVAVASNQDPTIQYRETKLLLESPHVCPMTAS